MCSTLYPQTFPGSVRRYMSIVICQSHGNFLGSMTLVVRLCHHDWITKQLVYWITVSKNDNRWRYWNTKNNLEVWLTKLERPSWFHWHSWLVITFSVCIFASEILRFFNVVKMKIWSFLSLVSLPFFRKFSLRNLVSNLLIVCLKQSNTLIHFYTINPVNTLLQMDLVWSGKLCCTSNHQKARFIKPIINLKNAFTFFSNTYA